MRFPPFRSLRASALVLLGALISTGCGLLDPMGCVADVAPGGFWMVVTDSISGTPLALGSAATATEETTHATFPFASPSQSATDSVLVLVSGQDPVTRLYFGEGRYSVRVERPGYRAWTRTGLVLAADRHDPCRALPIINLTARLVAVP